MIDDVVVDEYIEQLLIQAEKNIWTVLVIVM